MGMGWAVTGSVCGGGWIGGQVAGIGAEQLLTTNGGCLPAMAAEEAGMLGGCVGGGIGGGFGITGGALYVLYFEHQQGNKNE